MVSILEEWLCHVDQGSPANDDHYPCSKPFVIIFRFYYSLHKPVPYMTYYKTTDINVKFERGFSFFIASSINNDRQITLVHVMGKFIQYSISTWYHNCLS